MADLKITHFKVYQFSLPLNRPLSVGEKSLRERTGLILELGNGQGDLALGETSPLTGFSPENLTQVRQQLATLRRSVLERTIPNGLEALSGGFDRWLKDQDLGPSVRFGFETAVLGLLAAATGVPLPEFLGTKGSRHVLVNGLLAGTKSANMERTKELLAQGYRAFKLKVGRLALEEDLEMVRALKSLVGEDAVLRLDANRAWKLDQALFFAAGLSGIDIDYLEEPVRSFDQLIQLCQEPAMDLPVALDESLLKLRPEDLPLCRNIKALVLKPTLLGFEKTMRFARRALDVDMTPVISSAFESGVGLTVLSQMAALLKLEHVPAGLDTSDWFDEDLLIKPPEIEKGKLPVSALPRTVQDLKGHLLQVIADA